MTSACSQPVGGGLHSLGAPKLISKEKRPNRRNRFPGSMALLLAYFGATIGHTLFKILK